MCTGKGLKSGDQVLLLDDAGKLLIIQGFTKVGGTPYFTVFEKLVAVNPAFIVEYQLYHWNKSDDESKPKIVDRVGIVIKTMISPATFLESSILPPADNFRTALGLKV